MEREAGIKPTTRVTRSSVDHEKSEALESAPRPIGQSLLRRLTSLVPLFVAVLASECLAQPAQSPPVPPRVAQARRFLAERGWLGVRSAPESAKSITGRDIAPLSVANPPSTALWLPLGPTAVVSPNYGLVTGRVTSIAIDPSDPTGNRVFLGTTGGGVWKSQNAGSSGSVVFTPLTDAPSSLDSKRFASISIGALTVQPGGTGVILAGTGDPNDALDSYYGAGILRSTDGGNTWSVASRTADFGFSLQGEGLAGFAWSSVDPQLVVAAVSEAYKGTLVSAQLSTSYSGLYYSTDAGLTWSLATITDTPGQDVQGPSDLFASPHGNSVTAVVWNPVRRLFIAAVRFHGYYQSTDGAHWTRMAAQPGALTAQMCPTNPGSIGSIACPIFRGALAVNPISGDTFAWTVDLNNQDQGLWQDQCAIASGSCGNQAVSFAQRWSTAALELNTIQGSATIANGDYNLVLAAIPSAQDTLLFAGDNDLWKCSLAVGCTWRNTTNATTCASAQVAPYQHALAWNPANPQEVFLGNDSGIWRSMDAIGESGPVCSSDDLSHFQNLNAGIGSLAEVVSLSQSVDTPYTLLAGLGANGSAGVKNTTSPVQNWPQVLGGEGGPVAIDSTNPSNWFVNSDAGVSIYRCSSADLCGPGDFGSKPMISNADVQGDGYAMTTPAPFLIDPLDNTQLLVGTCRMWRGPVDGSGWTLENAISPILDGVSGLPYCSGDALIRSIAALPLGDRTEAVYVGTYGTLNGGGILAGHVVKAVYDPSASGFPAWQDVSFTPVSNDQVAFNYLRLDISSIFIDPHDPTGSTVYVTVAGAPDADHPIRTIYRTTDGGAHWTEIMSNLPESPANSIVIDPQDANTAYVATDQGVYSTRQVANCGAGSVNCWSVFGAGLPYAPVTQLDAAPPSSASSVLLAGTYGRGIWQIPLWTSGTQNASASVQPTSLSFKSQVIGTSSSSQNISITNTGPIGLMLTAVNISPGFSEFDNCTSSVLNIGATCAIQVTFVPVGVGSVSGQITISANVAGGQISIPLSGIGMPSGLVTATPGSLDFGQVPIGSTSQTQPVTLENAGSTPVPVSAITVAAPFALVANACGSSIAANSDCALSLAFSPTQPGPASGTLTIADTEGTQTVALAGSGAAAATDVISPTILTFPPTPAGQQSNPQIVTLTNNGGLPLYSISTATSAGFQSSSTCGSALAAHASCAVSIVFSPASAGNVSGSLRISDAIQTQTVALSGTALQPPALALSPGQLSFPALPVGQSALPLALTVTNSGGAPLSNLGFQISGSSAASFALNTGTCNATLNSMASCTVQVTCTPSLVGPLVAVVTVSSSTPGANPVQVPVTGYGQAPSGLSITPTQMTITQASIGQPSAPQTATIANSGSIVASNLVLSTQPPFSIFQNTCPSALAAGASCTAAIIFTPSGNGVVTGALKASSSSFVNSASALLTGIGGAAGTLQVQPTIINFPDTGVGASSAAQTVTLTNNGSLDLGTLLLSVSAGFQTASNTCGTSLAVGASCTVQVAFSPSVAGRQSGTLTISSPVLASNMQVALSGMGLDFVMSAQGQSSQTVASGQTASFLLSVAPSNGSSASLTFACGGLPAHSACSFNPLMVSVAPNATGTVTVKIATGVASSSAQNSHRPDGLPFPRAFMFACGLLVLPAMFRHRRIGGTLFLLLFAAALGSVSCAGSGGDAGTGPANPPDNNTPAGTYSVTVTATSAAISHKVTLALTVD